MVDGFQLNCARGPQLCHRHPSSALLQSLDSLVPDLCHIRRLSLHRSLSIDRSLRVLSLAHTLLLRCSRGLLSIALNSTSFTVGNILLALTYAFGRACLPEAVLLLQEVPEPVRRCAVGITA